MYTYCIYIYTHTEAYCRMITKQKRITVPSQFQIDLVGMVIPLGVQALKGNMKYLIFFAVFPQLMAVSMSCWGNGHSANQVKFKLSMDHVTPDLRRAMRCEKGPLLCWWCLLNGFWLCILRGTPATHKES